MNIYILKIEDDTQALDKVKLQCYKNYKDVKEAYNKEVNKMIKKHNIIELIEQNPDTSILKNNDYFNIFNVNYFDITIEIVKTELIENKKD